MPISPSARIHPTALLSPDTELADDVVVGPYVVTEGRVRIGAGCTIRPYAHLCGPLTLGQGNRVGSGAVLGERPQHLKYNDEPTRLEIGDHNIFREHVTVHRGTSHSGKTQIGSHNFLMVNSHVGHDCVIGDHCILTNGALVGGHCILEDRAYLSGNAAVHQFCRIGRLALLSGCSIATQDAAPFLLHQGFNCVVGVNVVGMRRAGLSNAQIHAVRRTYHLLFHQGLLLSLGMQRVEQELGHVDVVAEMLRFIRAAKRGIAVSRRGTRLDAEAA